MEPKKRKGLCFINGHPDDVLNAQSGAMGGVRSSQHGAMTGLHKSMQAAKTKVFKR